jgi:2,4-dienoyl-CoA reductase-like NADH-dependent reductase (Old Yellow Enzyme family)
LIKTDTTKEMVKEFGKGARRSLEASFDVLEIHRIGLSAFPLS